MASAGYTLTEVLVSLVILSGALFGLNALNLTSLRTSKLVWQKHLAQLEYENNIEKQCARVHSD